MKLNRTVMSVGPVRYSAVRCFHIVDSMYSMLTVGNILEINLLCSVLQLI
jgi:hypothetical protein